MAVTLDAVRTRIFARVGAMDPWQGEPWQPSRFMHALFGRTPASLAHLAFSVGVANAVQKGGRAGPQSGPLVESAVTVSFLHRVKPDSPRQAVPQTDSEDSATQAEDALLRHLLADGWAGDLRLTWGPGGNTRSVLGAGEWLRRDLAFTALYYLAP